MYGNEGWEGVRLWVVVRGGILVIVRGGPVVGKGEEREIYVGEIIRERRREEKEKNNKKNYK